MRNDLLKNVDNSIIQKQYESLVVKFIREKYNQDEENAILRKKLANIDDDNEFDIYNKYVEECKVKAKALLNTTE